MGVAVGVLPRRWALAGRFYRRADSVVVFNEIMLPSRSNERLWSGWSCITRTPEPGPVQLASLGGIDYVFPNGR